MPKVVNIRHNTPWTLCSFEVIHLLSANPSSSSYFQTLYDYTTLRLWPRVVHFDRQNHGSLESETINSFANWKSNVLYNLSLNNEFAQFLDSEWSKKPVANRGLQAVTIGNDTKTAVQRAIVLERMLGLVAQFVPSLLRSEIIKRSTSLSWIWNRLRKHYSFTASEVNFLKLSEIKMEEGERYETFYQRIIAHIEDNLLTVSSGLMFDGEEPTDDEELSPTAERLGVTCG